MIAPIVVFAYNRPDHLKRTLIALSANPEAKESDLFIFIDGYKNEKGKEKNEEVYRVALSFQTDYFKEVKIIRASGNQGLAKSVISGVTKIINRYGRVVVTEDDAVASPYYLRFMNDALDYYSDKRNIWSIGGYTVPLRIPENYDHDIIFTQRCSSYSWATWADRWNKIDWEVSDYKKFRLNFIERKRFNTWGNDKSLMLDAQMHGKINSWAIRFDYAMYCNSAYNVFPIYSLIDNIGHDGSGTHSTKDKSKNDRFKVNFEKSRPNHKLEPLFLDESIRKEYCVFFNKNTTAKIKSYIKINLLK